MARRPKFLLRRADPCLIPETTEQSGTAQLDYLSDFLTYGKITIGHMEPVGGVATASEGKHVYVMLRRGRDETLDQTLIRLDHAIGRVINELVYIDEINPL